MKKTLLLFAFSIIAATMSANFTSTEYYTNGKKKCEGQYTADPGITASDSKEVAAQKLGRVSKTGTWKYWFENGVQSSEEEYTAGGVATGTWKTWYMNGQLCSQINFGTSSATYWFENGRKSAEGSMNTAMQQTGKWVGWHENGNKNYEGSYSTAGQQEGVWTYWSPEGVKTAEQTWRSGALIDSKSFVE